MQKRHVILMLSLLVVLLAELVLLRSTLMKEEPVEVTTPPEMQQAAAPVVPDVVQLEEEAVVYDTPAEGYASYDALQLARAEEAAASMDLIMRLVVAEAGNQGYDGMRAVAQVIYDRRYNSTYDFGETFEEIIYADGQFCTPYAGDIEPWMPTVAEACEAVFYDGEYVFDEPVHYFYREDMISQSNRNWFETKKFVGVLGAHTFRSDYE